MFSHNLCGARVVSAWLYGKPVLVDAVPHRDGTLTVSHQNGSCRAERAQVTPYARQAALYRVHRCVKPEVAA